MIRCLLLLLLLVLALDGCASAAGTTPSLLITTHPPPLPTATAPQTATSTIELLTLTPTITPTLEIPAAAPTVARAPGTNVILDCASVYPGLPGCARENAIASGRLAFVHPGPPFDNHPTVIDLGHGGAWTLPGSGVNIAFSPSGEYLRVGLDVARFDGMVPDSRLVPITAFWAPLNAFPGANDRLVGTTADCALVATAFPNSETRELLPPGSLGSDGRGIVRMSSDGWLAWTLDTDQMVPLKQWEQILSIHPADRTGRTISWRVSADIRDTYYLPVEWAPGTHFILSAKAAVCNSCWSWVCLWSPLTQTQAKSLTCMRR